MYTGDRWKAFMDNTGVSSSKKCMEKVTEEKGGLETHVETTQNDSLNIVASFSTSEEEASIQDTKDDLTDDTIDESKKDTKDESKRGKINESTEDTIDESKNGEVSKSKEDKIDESSEDKKDESKEDNIDESSADNRDELKEDKIDKSKEDKAGESKENKTDDSKEDKTDESREKVRDKLEKARRDDSKYDETVEPGEDSGDIISVSNLETLRFDRAIDSADGAKQLRDHVSKRDCFFFYVKQCSEATLPVREVRMSPGDPAARIEHCLRELTLSMLEFSSRLDRFMEIVARLREAYRSSDLIIASMDAFYSGAVRNLCCVRVRILKLWRYLCDSEPALEIVEFGSRLILDISDLMDELYTKVESISLDIFAELQKDETKDNSDKDKSNKEEHERNGRI